MIAGENYKTVFANHDKCLVYILIYNAINLKDPKLNSHPKVFEFTICLQ